jgi:sirohydrochlorin cobaltochelatase
MSGPALLIAAHGTRDAAGQAEALALLRAVRSAAPEIEVECGFLELASPDIAAALDALVARGARDIVVFPSMLFSAGHTRIDIPSVIAGQRRRHPDVCLRYAGHFGADPTLLAMVGQRIDEVVAAEDHARTGILLVGRGASDPDANAHLRTIARLLQQGRPYLFVEVAFSGLAQPLVPEGLERCLRLGAERLVVVPYFLFTGILPKRMGVQVGKFAREHPQMQIRLARHLWPDDRLVALVLTRYREGISADPAQVPVTLAPPAANHQHHHHDATESGAVFHGA